MIPVPKPPLRERRKKTTWVKKRSAARRRAEAKQVQLVRPQVEVRDGFCRFKNVSALGPCAGRSEWAHFEDRKRSKTRGMPPEERHTTAGSLMLCTSMHDAYDAGKFWLRPLDQTAGADGRLQVIGADGTVLYEEA